MTDEFDKAAPERLELRARPRPIRRLNKRALIIGCAVAALFIAGATIIALSPARILKPGEKTELYNTDRKQTADGLSKLPKSYEDLPPRLGPPSPGDLGRAFVESEKKIGTPSLSEAPFRADIERPFYEMKKKPDRTLDADALTRASYLVGIFKALNILYSEKLADAWIQRPNSNRIFGGQTPLAYMVKGGLPAMQTVRRLLDARRGGM